MSYKRAVIYKNKIMVRAHVNCKYAQENRGSTLIALTETWLQDQDAGSFMNVDGIKRVDAI